MIVSIMQPYLFPYIGYFQLIQAVDQFVIYDDVNFIKQGWINRNRILMDGEIRYLTLQLRGASSFKLINEIEIGNNQEKMLKTVYHAYVKAPFYREVAPLLERIMHFPSRNLAEFVSNSIIEICKYLGIDTRFIISSHLEKNNDLTGEEKVLHICEILNTGLYINPFGGVELYSKKHFAQRGIELKFLQAYASPYQQFKKEFRAWLSILDILVFNSRAEIRRMLDEYNLV